MMAFMGKHRDLWLLIGLCAIILTSAFAFIGFCNIPVFDDSANLRDVTRYAENGVSVATIENHVNPAGPFAYIWIGLNGALLGGTLWSYRLVNALSALLLNVMLLCIATRHRMAIPIACLLLINPYLPLASSTILTEVPSLLFFVSGTLLWLFGLDQSLQETRCVYWPALVKLMGGALLIGVAIVGRQYYLAILPAMAVTVLMSFQRWGKVVWSGAEMIGVAISGIISAAPVILIFALWGGLTPPNMQLGISYSNSTATIGMNLLRPINAVLYIGIYMLPPLLLQRNITNRLRPIFLLFAFISALLLIALVPQGKLWCGTEAGCGPIDWLYRLVRVRFSNQSEIYNGILAFGGSMGILLFIRAVLSDHPSSTELRAVVFGASFLVFFVVEQAFVGGNIPFYERYTLQIAPMLGLALAGNRLFEVDRALIGSAPMILYGLFRLWRGL